MLTSLLALLVMQVGPDPYSGAMPDYAAEMQNRPPRTDQAIAVPEPRAGDLADCLAMARTDADGALDYAQGWRERANDQTDLAQSAHCLGLVLTSLSRFAEAQQVFALASDEAEGLLPAYRARLSAMAGNAALADGRPDEAETLFGQAIELAQGADERELEADLEVDRARALVTGERMEDAVASLGRARELDPADPRAWLLSATLSRRLERLGEAQRQIEQAFALDPRDPATGLEAGVIAALAGREDDARRSFESVLLVAPESAEADRARGYLAQLAQ